MTKKTEKSQQPSIPRNLLEPIKKFLEGELVKWKRAEKSIKRGDPFSDPSRTVSNTDENDTDEQVGHFEAQVKANFIRKQIVQLRKALTMIKIGRYGICEKCGKMIDTDRLAIKPDTTLCIEHAREKE